LETLALDGGLLIPDKTIAEIRLLSSIAKSNGSLLSLQDIATLTDVNLTEEQLQASWPTIRGLAETYELKHGFMIERERGNSAGHPTTLQREMEKRARGEKYANFARKFASYCMGRGTKMIAVSGSTSYHAVSETDDLDFFCVTKPESLWIFLTRSLLFSRVFRLAGRDTPRICFSYAVDQDFAEKEFASSNDPLFARDALAAIVIHGVESYKGLLKRSSWIANYFPRLYQRRTGSSDPRDVLDARSNPSPRQKFLNLLLCFLVGNYITTKSTMLNRKFRKQSRSSSLFTVRIGSDHCIFESARYSHLRTMYNKLDEKLSVTGGANLVSGGDCR
jgi:hypothetical protein